MQWSTGGREGGRKVPQNEKEKYKMNIGKKLKWCEGKGRKTVASGEE